MYLDGLCTNAGATIVSFRIRSGIIAEENAAQCQESEEVKAEEEKYRSGSCERFCTHQIMCYSTPMGQLVMLQASYRASGSTIVHMDTCYTAYTSYTAQSNDWVGFVLFPRSNATAHNLEVRCRACRRIDSS